MVSIFFFIALVAWRYLLIPFMIPTMRRWELRAAFSPICCHCFYDSWTEAEQGDAWKGYLYLE